MFGICNAITHKGTRCTSDAADAAGKCDHHARIARALSLASTKIKTSEREEILEKCDYKGVNELKTNGLRSSPPRVINRACVTTQSEYTAKSSEFQSPNTQAEDVVTSVGCVEFCLPESSGLQSVRGTLWITTFRLRFEPEETYLRDPGNYHLFLDEALNGIPCACVAKLAYPTTDTVRTHMHIKGVSSTHSYTPSQIIVKFKSLKQWILAGNVQALMLAINRASCFDSPLRSFAFKSFTIEASDREKKGHELYDIYTDFWRMGVDLSRDPTLRLTTINKQYQLCPTYPQEMVVPAPISDEDIGVVANFRSKSRIPMCCYMHKSNGASIWRCAQPKRGIFNANNVCDEQYLYHLCTTKQKTVWIADCRPELNARANNLTGGGTESSSIAHVTIAFLNIANIHSMRDSLEQLYQLVHSTSSEQNQCWWAWVEETKWLQHIRLLLAASLRVADTVDTHQTTVLVHCSDGWDRTGQLCALSQILLDGHYRTLRGFLEIIDKEWIRAGHKFHDRVGLGISASEEQSPVFLQFLDCVWQLWRQYPAWFEFSPRILVDIADAVFSGQFGTFIGNCDQERRNWNITDRTPSFWAHALENEALYVNPFYRCATMSEVLLPPSSSVLRQVSLWMDYYFRSSTFSTLPPKNKHPAKWKQTSFCDLNRQHTSTTIDDLIESMMCAKLHIEALEEKVKAQRAEIALLERMRPPSNLFGSNSNTTQDHVASFSELGIAASPSNSRPLTTKLTFEETESKWRCQVCCKLNSADNPRCNVCGQPS
uniref:Myotubularin related protein 2 putative n=1 Tax=Albugo laibachii Nc14 TaxID=890382 RepID=F0WNR3_9STRA|nr:Myotubularin related protein 2 putative [Albugo laibachii Nc14]|eukprot:CCA22955.1 Myotubularin related protein 2 putative [Albugo laibachii Nc14]